MTKADIPLYMEWAEREHIKIDLFIAEEHLLGQGLGTQIVQQFSDWLLTEKNATRVLIDPDSQNKRALRCYEKAGFTPCLTAWDGTCEVLILEKKLKQR